MGGETLTREPGYTCTTGTSSKYFRMAPPLGLSENRDPHIVSAREHRRIVPHFLHPLEPIMTCESTLSSPITLLQGSSSAPHALITNTNSMPSYPHILAADVMEVRYDCGRSYGHYGIAEIPLRLAM